MRLGTHQECVGSSPKVSGVCQDGTREFARRRPRLVERLSGVAEKVARNNRPRSSLGIRPGLDDAVGPRREFAVRFTEGIEKLARNTSGDRRKKTIRPTVRIPEAAGLAGVNHPYLNFSNTVRFWL
ncbi:hypothetical protein B296_00000782 [Ensete ventricosum]|uniref:Uncharacterized protein n=1 Tax=Ensete ventricosum TaxID=4639 RepID=A0A427A2T8_ENSVE|nr:hypothetical protein B296_00000782 [Ensete ventricosum]